MSFLVFGHLCLLGSSYSFWSAHFSLTASVSQGTLYLVLGFVGIHFDAASRCASTRFSYSSFGVPFSVFSCSASNQFLNSNAYLSLISIRNYSMIGGHTLERGVCLAIHRTVFPFPVYKDVVYLWFTIIRVCVSP